MSYYDNNHVAANYLTHQTILFASITTKYARILRVRAGSSASKLSATITPDGQGARSECIISI